ncbi:DUF2163 domain-containing protein [Desulfosarcina sp. OttesenSCG-928-G10]|nr:DUF2163 domain-containing protein [Desulfosarcina sp. OttesenSCG-928-G10]MDL2322244.1 DUF2163 domain-containing protein [Desulfosarcina sp. OttesenSCG-928-B08]
MTTPEYIALENSTRRKPVELFHIWRRDVHFRHTSADVAVEYGGHSWLPATINRDRVSFSHDMRSSEVSVTFLKTDPAISIYIAGTPMSFSEIEIRKVFRDDEAAGSQLVFTGEILEAAAKGLTARATCSGIERRFQDQMLQDYYQPACNNTLFDRRCGLLEADYTVTTAISLDSTGTKLTADAFGTYADNWFRLGEVRFNGDFRPVAEHVGSVVTLVYPLVGLASGDTVTVLPGCDGDVETCKTQYTNLARFFGFPAIPYENPSAWVNK